MRLVWQETRSWHLSCVGKSSLVSVGPFSLSRSLYADLLMLLS